MPEVSWPYSHKISPAWMVSSPLQTPNIPWAPHGCHKLLDLQQIACTEHTIHRVKMICCTRSEEQPKIDTSVKCNFKPIVEFAINNALDL